jgi:hypothetical protein
LRDDAASLLPLPAATHLWRWVSSVTAIAVYCFLEVNLEMK